MVIFKNTRRSTEGSKTESCTKKILVFLGVLLVLVVQIARAQLVDKTPAAIPNAPSFIIPNLTKTQQ